VAATLLSDGEATKDDAAIIAATEVPTDASADVTSAPNGVTGTYVGVPDRRTLAG
jgi:hypothetical protein